MLCKHENIRNYFSEDLYFFIYIYFLNIYLCHLQKKLRQNGSVGGGVLAPLYLYLKKPPLTPLWLLAFYIALKCGCTQKGWTIDINRNGGQIALPLEKNNNNKKTKLKISSTPVLPSCTGHVIRSQSLRSSVQAVEPQYQVPTHKWTFHPVFIANKTTNWSETDQIKINLNIHQHYKDLNDRNHIWNIYFEVHLFSLAPCTAWNNVDE